MPNITSVGITNGVPTSGSGTVSTLDGLIANGLQVNVGAAAATPANPVPIFDGYVAPTSATWNSATALNTAFTLATAGMDTVILTLAPSGSITAGQIVFEAFDGFNWVAIKAPRTDSYLTDAAFTLSGSPGVHSWQVPVAGYPQFRARLGTAIVGAGTVQVVGIVSSAPDTSIVTVGLDPNQPLPAGANNIGSVSIAPSTTDVAVTPTVTAGAYVANNVLGGVMTFAGLLAPTSFNGILESITAKFKDTAVTGSLTVALFKATPVGTYTDHAAPTWNAADMANLVGIYTLSNPQNLGGSAMTVYNLDGIGKAIVGASQSLYAVVTVGGTPTPASTSSFTLELAALPG